MSPDRVSRVRVSFALAVAIATAILLPSFAQAKTTHSATAQTASLQVSVLFKSTLPVAAQRSVFAHAGLVWLHKTGSPRSAVGRASSVQAASRAIRMLHQDPRISYAGHDHLAQAALIPNDEFWAGSTMTWSWTNGNFPAAWDVTTGSASVIIAIVDSGVDATNPDLQGSVLPGFNFVAGNTNTADDSGHGTQVAGAAAAHGNNRIGVTGACWSCQILPVKVLDAATTGTTSNIASGIRWAADHGADVINLSIAGPANDPTVSAAISYAVGLGAFVVIAAGNSSSTDPTVATGGYPGWNASQISGAISVGALDLNDALYGFSNFGPWVEVAAAGCIMTTYRSGSYLYNSGCGTSIAAPQVAGLAALLLSVTPGLTPAQLETKIETSANSLKPVLHAQTLSCGGPCTAFGRIDAQEALSNSTTSLPANTSLPTLSGSARDGQTFVASPGTWSGTGVSTSFAWQRSTDSGATWTAITGATHATYTLTSASVGAIVRVNVTGTNTRGGVLASSAATAVVTASAATIASVTLFGTAQVGQTLIVSAGVGGTAPVVCSYLWERSGGAWTTIAGATGSSYTLTSADVGLTVRATLTVSNSASSASHSALSGVVVVAASGTTPPVAGGGSGGSEPDLTLSIATDSPPTLNGSVTYRLKVWAKIGNGATGHADTTFALPSQVQISSVYVGHGPGCTQAGQVLICNLDWINPGEPVTVIVQGSVTSFGTLTATASVHANGELNTTDNNATLVQSVVDPAAPAASPSAPSSTPKTTKSGAALPASPSLYSSRDAAQLAPGATLSLDGSATSALAARAVSGSKVSYRWQAAGSNNHFTNIAAQTHASLTLTSALVGKQVRVQLSVRSATGQLTITSKSALVHHARAFAVNKP